MLPVVVIGADDSVRAAFEQWEHVLFYDTAEDAVFGLDESFAKREREAEPDLDADPVPQQDDRGYWHATVVYGPKAQGLAASGQQTRLLHIGWTVVAASGIRDTATVPRRVRDERAEGEDATTLVFQSQHVLGAQHIVDVDVPGALTTLRTLLTERPAP